MALTDGAEFQGKCPIFSEVQRLLQLLGLVGSSLPTTRPIPNSLKILKEIDMLLALSPDTHNSSLEGLARRSYSSCSARPLPVFQAAPAPGLSAQLMCALRAGPAGTAASSITTPSLEGSCVGTCLHRSLFPSRVLGTKD